MSPDGTVLHGCPPTGIAGCYRQMSAQSRRESDIYLRRGSRARSASRDGVCRPAIQGDSALLEGMDREIKVQGPLARNGPPVRPHVEAADQPGAWIAHRCPDIFRAGKDWGSAQLGLSFYLVARCGIHALCLDPPGFH